MTCKHDNIEFIGIYSRVGNYVCWVRTIVCCKDCNVEIDPVDLEKNVKEINMHRHMLKGVDK